jgi:four helix bundle protein
MARFLRVAIGSICELESQIELSKRLGFVEETSQILSEAGVLKARIKTLEDRVLILST